MAYKSTSPSTSPIADAKSADNVSMELRVLLTNEEASVIIGRKGVNATRIRTETGVFLTILKTETPCPERLMVLKGQPAALAGAILIIAQLLTEPGVKGTQPTRPFVLRILTHKFLVGSVIGPAGAIVREIQSTTQARVSLSVEPLPNSTDKVCSLSGTPEAISAAAARVIAQFAQNPLRPGCSVVPYVPNSFANPAFSGFQALYPSLPASSTFASGHASRPASSSSPPSSSTYRTEKIVIPDACAGAVIGKAGTIIKDIKTQSGATISLADASQAGDRIVSITGTLQGIQVASFLIRQRVELQQQQLQQQTAVNTTTKKTSAQTS